MLLKKGKGKRIMCAILACALVLVPMTPASAATARATTMKLEKKEGTVTLKTQSGTTRRITNGMRLYNGNSLTTGKKSYAYVSLDSAKAVKLDQSSSATLRQNGKNLELLVKSGKLFFNVSKPLTKKENMNVRTSTMVTGIRGTCGVVEPVTQTQSKLYLIEGKVTMGTGEQAVTVKGGQTATVTLDAGSEQAVQVEKLTESDIPPVALQEIVNDIALQKKIEQTTDLDIAKIKAAFEQWQKEENGQDGNGQGQQDDKKDDTKKDEDSSGSSSGGSSSSGETKRETILTGTVTSGAILAAFAQYDKVHIGFQSASSATLKLDAGETLEIPTGKQLMLWGTQTVNGAIKAAKGGLLCVPEGAAAAIGGRLELAAGSTLETHGTLELAQLISAGGAVIKNTNTIRISGGYTAGSTDTYYGGSGVLISSAPLDAMPEAWLLMTGGSRYFYADALCKHVVENMSASVTYDFKKNADVPAGSSVEIDNFHASLNGNELGIAGSLKLNGNTSITGSGTATIRLKGGTLELTGQSESAAGDLSLIENTGNGYAIARDTAGIFKWNHPDIRIKANAQAVAIQGATQTGGSSDQRYSMCLPAYCQLKQGYRTWWDTDSGNQTQTIGLEIDTSNVPYEFKAGDSVSMELLNEALQKHHTVTVDAGVSINANTEELQIPEAATLIMNGELNEVGTAGLAGTLQVGTTGTVSIKTLELNGQATMINQHLIRINTVADNSTGAKCRYEDTNQNGVLVVGGEELSGDLFTGVTRLVKAVSSDFKSLEWIYAAGMTQLVADQMQPDQIIDGQPVHQWNFSRNAVVSETVVWDLTGTNVGMAANELQIAAGASLTLRNIGDIGGTGNAVIRIGTGAHLIVEETDESEASAETTSRIHCTNSGYAIAVDEVNASAASVTADITLSDANLSLAATTAEKIVQGMQGSETLPAFIKIADGYQWKITQGGVLWTLTLENN